MYPRLPSTFLEKTETIEAEFLRVARLAVDDIRAKFFMAGKIKFENFQGHHPNLASKASDLTKYSLRLSKAFAAGAIIAADTLPNDRKIIFIPFALITSPIMPTLTTVNASIGVSGLRGFVRELTDEITGNGERVLSRKAIQCLDDNSDPQKHLILETAPT